MSSKYICIHYKTQYLELCKTCCGVTNLCGTYENETGEDPFYRPKTNLEKMLERTIETE